MSFIDVTTAAAVQIKSLLDREEKHESHGLRIKVVGGGCSGLQYQLAFDENVGETDAVDDSCGVKVIVDEKSALYLAGSQLDFVDSLMESGFKIENPNASVTCGCGESFGV